MSARLSFQARRTINSKSVLINTQSRKIGSDFRSYSPHGVLVIHGNNSVEEKENIYLLFVSLEMNGSKRI